MSDGRYMLRRPFLFNNGMTVSVAFCKSVDFVSRSKKLLHCSEAVFTKQFRDAGETSLVERPTVGQVGLCTTDVRPQIL